MMLIVDPRTVKMYLILTSLVYFLQVIIGLVSAHLCYECAGLNCEPSNAYLVKCKMNTTKRCFFVGWNSSGIYRGCYEPQAIYLNYCKLNRLTSCSVCEGEACNNEPIFQSAIFSCKKCDWGECDSRKQAKINFFQCEAFVTGTIPRCFTRFKFGEQVYKFGCENEMNREDVDACQGDTFQTLCRFCTVFNCNTQFYFDYFIDNLRFTCQSSNYLPVEMTVVCNFFQFRIPIYGCYINREKTIYQCANEIRYPRYKEILEEESAIICQDSVCNNPEIQYWVTGCWHSGLSRDVFCVNIGSSCVTYNYIDENNIQQTRRGCESTTPCWNRMECMRCSEPSLLGTVLCNSPGIIYSHKCYKCKSTECAIINNLTLFQSESCLDLNTGKTECATYFNGDLVVRGCYDRDFEFLNICEMDKDNKNCTVCKGDLCNWQSLRFFCFNCTFFNGQCKYDQSESLLVECRYMPGFFHVGCYTLIRQDGMVERGCYKSEDKECPPNTECITCQGHGCNRHSVIQKYCSNCSGTMTSSCALDVEEITNQRNLVKCSVQIHQPLCYTMIENNTHFRRGCTGHFGYREKLRRLCGIDNYQCFFCDEDKCNIMTLTKSLSWNLVLHIFLRVGIVICVLLMIIEL